MAEVILRKINEADLPQVADVHLKAFPKSAITSLGKEAVRRYYEWQLLGPHNALRIGVFCGAELAGFCFAGVFRGAMSGFLGKHRNYLIWNVISHPWLISNPLFRNRLIEGMKVLKRFSKSNSAKRSGNNTVPKVTRRPLFGVLAIAVDPKFQGQCIGKMLMAEVERQARQSGIAEMNLSVNVTNTQAINFYNSLGWQKVEADGVWHGEMVKELK